MPAMESGSVRLPKTFALQGAPAGASYVQERAVPAMEWVSEAPQNLRTCKALLQGLLYVQERAVPAMEVGDQ